MISRKDLVEALRVLHETDQITKITTRAKRIDIQFQTQDREGLLIIPNPNENQKKNRRQQEDTQKQPIS